MVLHPSLDHRLIAQIEHVVQEVKSHHEADGFSGSAGIRIQRTQLGLKFCPIDLFGKLPESLSIPSFM